MRRKRETQAAGSTDLAAPSQALRDGTKLNVHFVTPGRNQSRAANVTPAGWATALVKSETTKVVGRQYLTRQATTLLKFAKTVTDPNVAAGLVEKAAELKSQMDESNLSDRSARAPDVERNNNPGTLER